MMELIVNVSEDWGIGSNGKLLVPIRDDLKRFREYTLGKTVVLGRKTLETFPNGKPLDGRRNLILSSNCELTIPGAEVVNDISSLFGAIKADEDVVVIGGESVYRQLLPYCERALVTKSYTSLNADRFFPNLDALPNWVVESSSDLKEENRTKYRYVNYVNTSIFPFKD